MLGSYGPISVIQAVGSFLIVSLLARLLTTDQFGQWILVEQISLLMAQILLVGGNYSVIKLIASDKVPVRKALDLILKRTKFFILFGWIATSIAGFVVEKKINGYLVIGSWVVVESLYLLALSAARGAGKVSAYSFAVFLRIGGVVLLLSIFSLREIKIASASTVLLLYLVTSTLAVISLFMFFWYSSKIESDKNNKNDEPMLGNNPLSYGIPILIGSFFSALISTGDRYVLSYMASTVDVAIYSVHFKAASALTLISAPINLWWPAARFNKEKDIDGGAAFFNQTSIKAVIGFTGAGSVLWLLSSRIENLIMPGVEPNVTVSACLIGSIVLNSVGIFFSPALLKSGNTNRIPYILLLVAIFQSIILVLMVRFFGFPGAAIATLFGSIFLFAAQHVVSQKILYVKYSFLILFAFLILNFTFLVFLSSFFDKDIYRATLYVVVISVIIFGYRKTLV